MSEQESEQEQEENMIAQGRQVPRAHLRHHRRVGIHPLAHNPRHLGHAEGVPYFVNHVEM